MTPLEEQLKHIRKVIDAIFRLNFFLIILSNKNHYQVNMKHFIFGIFLLTSTFLYSQNPNIDLILDDYRNFFHKMNDNFVDEIDLENFIIKTKKRTIQQLDPHSHFYTKEESDKRNQTWKGISYAGIGAMIKQTDQGVVIDYCKEGYGAALAGLLPGDIFIKVDSVDCANYNLNQLIKLLRGKDGTTLNVTVLREEEVLIKTIKRKNIISNSISFADTISKEVGLIKVNQFLRGSGDDFRKSVQEVLDKGANKLVLDFRGNIGGLVVEVVRSLSAFLPKGTVVYTLKSKDKKSCYADSTKNEPLSTTIPLVMLIDNKTVSSGEIFTGALQDLDRGVLLGQKTHGKGLVQGTRYFKDGSSLYITAARYHLPSGRCIQKKDYRKNYSQQEQRSSKLESEIFKSKNGRIFSSSDGISPDKKLVKPSKSDLIKAIEKSTLIFDFAVYSKRKYGNELFSKNDEITKEWIKYVRSNCDQFYLENENKFQEFIKTNQWSSYNAKKFQKHLIREKKRQISREKNEIAEILLQKLILYDQYMKGLYRYNLKKDPWVLEAIDVLTQTKDYQKILE